MENKELFDEKKKTKKKVIKVEKEISLIWHYFLLFWFILSLVSIICAMILFFVLVSPYIGYIQEGIRMGIDYLGQELILPIF